MLEYEYYRGRGQSRIRVGFRSKIGVGVRCKIRVSIDIAERKVAAFLLFSNRDVNQILTDRILFNFHVFHFLTFPFKIYFGLVFNVHFFKEGIYENGLLLQIYVYLLSTFLAVNFADDLTEFVEI